MKAGSIKEKNRYSLGVLIVFLVVILIQAAFQFEPFDDAFITYRYARNISNGLGFVYNPGEKVLGTTSPLFALLLSLVGFVINSDSIPYASYLISLISDVLSVWLLFQITYSLFEKREFAFIVSGTFLLHPYRLVVTNGGMETSLFIACLLATYYFYFIGNRSYLTSVMAAITFLIRPDAILAIIPIYVDWFFKDRSRIVCAILLSALIVSPWLLWSTSYFGSPLPHSIIAKSITYKNPPAHAAAFLSFFFGTGTIGPYTSPNLIIPLIMAGFMIIILGLAILIKNRSSALIMGSYPLLYAFVMIVLNPSMIFPWYYLPLIPGLLILVIGIIRYVKINGNINRSMIAGILSIFILIVPATLMYLFPSSLTSRSRESAFWDVCDFIKMNEIDKDVIYAPDIGVIGWCFEDSTIVDPIGLVSPVSLEYSKELMGKDYISFDQIDKMRPDLMILLDHFIDQDQIDNEEVLNLYKVIYEKKLLIADNEHTLFALQLIE